MTTAEAWAVVEGILTSSSLSFTSLGFLPGVSGAMLDDNFPVESVPVSGGIRMSCAQGSLITTATPGAVMEPLVFSLEMNFPLGEGNARTNTYPGQVTSLFIGKSFPPVIPSSNGGSIVCTRTQVDRIGQPADGRPIYRVIVNLVFDNHSYLP
jgi:hypothetical protein